MKSKEKQKGFEAVSFMREQRDRLSSLYQTDRSAFYAELEKANQDFIAQRKRKQKKPHQVS
jgi:hypothetical protein